MDTLMLFLELFGTFFLIGAFTIGGGYAMLSLIQAEVVTTHGWISESTFTDIVAISQMTPGPIGINSATYVGYDVLAQATGSHLLGIAGSATATLALVLPSFILVLLIVRFYTKFKSSALFEGVMGWLRPRRRGHPHREDHLVPGHAVLRRRLGKLPGLEELVPAGRGLRRLDVGKSQSHPGDSGRRRARPVDLLIIFVR